MKIKKEELNYFKTNVVYEDGYRIVYYYEKYHDVPQGLYAKNIEDFVNFFQEKDKIYKFKNIDDILNKFLYKNPDALGVAIYNINQECIARKFKENVKNINNSQVFKEELIYDYNYVTKNDGYRLVYFKDDGTYSVGAYCKKIEDFMMDFVEYEPIIDENDIPPFISTNDILNRSLNLFEDISAVAIYSTNGECIDILCRKK